MGLVVCVSGGLFYSRGSLVEIRVFDSEDVNGSFITGDAQEGGIVAEADAEVNNVSKLKTVVAEAEINNVEIIKTLKVLYRVVFKLIFLIARRCQAKTKSLH